MDFEALHEGVSNLMATLLPSITTGLRASSSSLLSSLFMGDTAGKGSCRVGSAAWMSCLDTRTDIVVTGPCLASWPAWTLTSSPRSLSVSMLGPNCCFTAWTWAVEYPSLWKKSNWVSRHWGSGEGSSSPGYMLSQKGWEEFRAGRQEGGYPCRRVCDNQTARVSSAFIFFHSALPHHLFEQSAKHIVITVLTNT